MVTFAAMPVTFAFKLWRSKLAQLLGWAEPLPRERDAWLQETWLEARRRGRAAARAAGGTGLG